jgi:hypothetical protein
MHKKGKAIRVTGRDSWYSFLGFYLRNLKGRDYLRDLGVGGKIILIFILSQPYIHTEGT